MMLANNLHSPTLTFNWRDSSWFRIQRTAIKTEEFLANWRRRSWFADGNEAHLWEPHMHVLSPANDLNCNKGTLGWCFIKIFCFATFHQLTVEAFICRIIKNKDLKRMNDAKGMKSQLNCAQVELRVSICVIDCRAHHQVVVGVLIELKPDVRKYFKIQPSRVVRQITLITGPCF